MNLADHPGSQPFTPTCLEWLAVELNALSRREFIDGYNLSFLADRTSDSITIFIRHSDQVDRQGMNRVVAVTRELIEEHAKARGWEWLKIREDIRPLEP